MTNKVTQIRGDDSAPVVVAEAPNKMIGVESSMLEKLSGALNTVVAEREKNLCAVRAATAILLEAPPPGFDHEATGRAIAQARVDDLMTGGSTVEAVTADFYKRRADAEGAIAKHEGRLAEARQQLEQANQLEHALAAQGSEIDKAVRKEFALFGSEKSTEWAEALSRSVTRYLDDFIDYRAAIWLRGVQNYGDKTKQFSSADDEMDLMFAVPADYVDMLPEGWIKSATPGVVVFKAYMVKQFVQKRGVEIMEAKTGGIFPKAGAGLPRPQDS